MSIKQNCYPCMFGDHDKHDRNWGLGPGLIGGSWCGCQGECVEGAQRSYERMMRDAVKSEGRPGAQL